MNVSRDVAEAALRLGGEILPWAFGRLDNRLTTVAGQRFEQAAAVSAVFVEVRWPDAFFRTPDEPRAAIRMRFVEQRFVHAERAFATFALDVVSGRTWSLALGDPALEVHEREGFEAPTPTGRALAAWLSQLAPTDRPEADRTAWTRELAGALRRGDLDEARAVVERVGPRARHPLLGTTPLHHVALAGTLELFDELVANGAPLDAATTQDGDTPFVYAAWGAQPAILERCLALHGTPDDRQLARALDHAIMFDKVVPVDAPASRDPARVVERLLACGADPLRAPEDPSDERPAARLFAKAVTNARMGPLVDVFRAHGAVPDTPRGEPPEHAEAVAAAEAQGRAKAEATDGLRHGTVKAGAFTGMSGHAKVIADGQVEAVLSLFGQETRVTMPARDFAFDDGDRSTD